MKLIRFGAPGRERPGVELDDGTRRDVSMLVPDCDAAFFDCDGVRRMQSRMDDIANCPQLDGRTSLAGFLICNDVSERSFQFERGTEWTKGKSCDSFAPLGPYLVTTDTLGNPHGLELTTRVNGRLRQSGNTYDLIFNIPFLVWYLSQFLRLEPGNNVTTGTPYGVAMASPDPDAYLKPGDRVELQVSCLGTQAQSVATHEALL
ncbi:MAG: fumarylacetoacetate hydrolase family protein [Gammaproteobacteria bacterium]